MTLEVDHRTVPPAGEDPPPRTDGGRRGPNVRVLGVLAVALAIIGVLTLLLEGGNGGGAQRLPGNVHSATSASFRGSVASPPQSAPPLQLRNDSGQTVNIDRYRGKAVLVTFLYTNCPDVCPLIAANLRVTQSIMGPAETAKTQIIAVSVDPRGDTPKAVSAFLKRHRMTGRMQYLIGSAHELGQVWSAWNVGSKQDAQQPQLVNHSGLVYGISASGKITSLYAANFKPADIAHDVPLLLAR